MRERERERESEEYPIKAMVQHQVKEEMKGELECLLLRTHAHILRPFHMIMRQKSE